MAIAAKKKTAKKKPSPRRSAEFLVDEKGRRTAVLLPIKQYEKMVSTLEDLYDLEMAAEARAEEGEDIPWEVVKAELREKHRPR